MRDGVEVDKIYLSAFEGCIYDTSAGAYLLKDEQTADFDNDKLSSISDAKPCSGQSQALTLANARKLAHNRGAGWEQMTIQSISVTQLLFIIEYATFDSQSAIGIGACGKTDESGINIAENSGTTLLLGNRTGAVYNSNNIQFVSYRGEENLWGNIGSLIDGIAGYKDKEFGAGKYLQMYKSVSGFSENTSEYINIGSGPKYGQSYASSFVYYPDCDWLFSASDLNGSSAFPIGDMTWNASGKNIWVWVALTGGIGSPVSQVNSIGLFARNCNFSLTASLRTFGVRLTYIPQKKIRNLRFYPKLHKFKNEERCL